MTLIELKRMVSKMNELKYFKGNWTTFKGSDDCISINCDGKAIGDAWNLDNSLGVEVMEANARLMKASPKMYEMLKTIVDHFRNNDENYYSSELCTEAINVIREIEKDGK